MASQNSFTTLLEKKTTKEKSAIFFLVILKCKEKKGFQMSKQSEKSSNDKLKLGRDGKHDSW